MRRSCRNQKRERSPQWHVSLALVLLLVGVGCNGGASSAPASSTPHLASTPNIVLYLIDTLRADHLGLYGYEKKTSPNIDSLARESVVFDHAYGAAPWTLPSVVSLMTSTFVCEHKVAADGQKVPPSLPTLAERLARIDYATASFYGNIYAGPMSGLDRGYSHHQFVVSDRACAAVEQWLDQGHRGPKFIYVHTVEPHGPYAAPEAETVRFGAVSEGTRKAVNAALSRYRQLTRVDWDNKTRIGTTDNTQLQMAQMERLAQLKSSIVALYDGEVRVADENLGRMVEKLKARGLWDDTLFILVADHGEEFGEHGGWQHDQSVYEELAHVPMMVHFPQGQFAGKRVGTVVSLVDVLPTIFDYIGRPDLTSPSRGRSMMPLIRGDEPPEATSLRVPSMRRNTKKYYRPFKEKRGDVNVVVRQGRWKGIWNVEPGSFELFDLAQDPGENDDVNERYLERATAMREHAAAWLRHCQAATAKADSESVEGLDSETRERLRALGYVN